MSSRQVFQATLIVILTVAAAYILMINVRILVVLLLAIMIASALRPIIQRLVKWRVPEGLAIILTYGGIVLIISLLLVAVVPPVFNQMANYLENNGRLSSRIITTKLWLESNLSNITNSTVELGKDEDIISSVNGFIASLRATAPHLAGDVGGLLGEAVLVFIMGIYWLTSRDKAINFVTQLTPLRSRETAHTIVSEIESSMGAYLRGMMMVSTFVGVANTIILSLFRVPNSILLGFIIGITTMLPIVGGFIGGGLSTILATLTSTPLNGLITFASFVAVQQIETHYLTPRTMSKSVGVDTLLIFVAVFIGFTLGGVIGAILSVPLTGALSILAKYLIIEPRKTNVQAFTVENGVPVFNQEPIAPASTTPKIIVPNTAAAPTSTTILTPNSISTKE